jgi:pimeloyl-ACP methyl ester carboxylesterase
MHSHSHSKSGFLRYLLALGFFLTAAHAAEPTSNPAGHWEGTLTLPGVPLAVRVDLDRTPGGAWRGTVDIPVQGLRGFKLDPVTVDGAAVRFAMPGIPGDPQFAGRFDGAVRPPTLAGEFTQAGQTFPFRLEQQPRPSPDVGQTPSRGVPGQGVVGYWQGAVKPVPALELRLGLEVTNRPSAGLGGVLISLDQGGVRIPITSLSETNAAVRFETASVGGRFSGKFNDDGSDLAGEWTQGGQAMPLTFMRLNRAPNLRRPQEPQRPFPYRDIEVSVSNAAAGIVLAGTLTVPPGPGPHPAVVLVTGSGPQDRDEAVMGHRPFLVLADHLSRAGIAVLRCDDRGVGGSSGQFAQATLTDFVADALAAVAFLRAHADIDPKRIGMVGHSEGGVIGPLAATQSTNIAFLVLLAGVGVPMEALLIRQGRDVARVMGAGEDSIAHNTEFQRRLFQIVRNEPDHPQAEKLLRAAIAEEMARMTETQRSALGLTDTTVDGQVRTLLSPWFRDLIRYDPRPALKQVRCPVLALNGEKDVQVAAAENLDAIRAALLAGGNTRVKTVALPGLNHLFQHCPTGAVAEYSTIEETISPDALRIISDWIRTIAAP